MKINDYEKEWDMFKKHTNPYEYIHTVIPNKKKCVSKCKPLSRSYFKMIEIVHTFKLADMVEDIDIESSYRYAHPSGSDYVPRHLMKSKRVPIQSFHLAEGPGGFIEALVQLRQNSNDTYIGMTILDNTSDLDDYNIPAWKKSQQFLKENPNVIIENGADGTGNILNLENLVYCKEKYASSMDLITADGGFDFSSDFNNQEISIASLLFAQIAFALCMQKKNGSFVLKVFDCFMPHTVDLLYILSSFYEKVYIAKPQTSRYANSEKYIVCKKFTFSSCDDFYPVLYDAFIKACDSKACDSKACDSKACDSKACDSKACDSKACTIHGPFIHRFLNIPISNYFLSRLEEYNSIFGQQQIENIYYTISLIETKNKSEKIDMLIKTNIQKCVQWCIKYDVPHHVIATTTNIFLSSSSFL
jgi:23S rRNA U2552 (ribose-2'-O)-methylase RlmE/FtsJ